MTLSGTASDASSGLLNVRLKITNVTENTYWNGSSWVVSDPGYTLSVTGTTSWTYSAPTLTDGRQYLVNSRATDNAANVETPSAGTSFKYDGTAPSSVITYPAGGAKLNANRYGYEYGFSGKGRSAECFRYALLE